MAEWTWKQANKALKFLPNCVARSRAPRIPAAWEHGAPGSSRLMPPCLLLSSQALAPSALQNPGHWRKRKENEDNIHFPSNFQKTSDWEALTFPSASTGAAVLFVVICEIRRGSVATSGDATRWTRQGSLHSHAPNFLKYRLGGLAKTANKRWLFTVS